MGRILDYHCSFNTAEQATLSEAAYKNRDEMARLAKEQSLQNNSPFCVLPFCHTLEAEAMGAQVSFSGVGGARVRNFCFQSLEELGNISLNHDSLRLVETIAACKLLQEQGERVLFQISGPLTILGSLLPPEAVFRALRKQPEQVLTLILRLGEEIKRLILRLECEGINLFSYADPSGALNLIGPIWMEQITKELTWPLLRQLDTELRRKTLVFLCPKTAFALLGCELAQWQDHPFTEAQSYRQAALSLQGNLRFVGQSCINRLDYTCETIKELKLEGQA